MPSKTRLTPAREAEIRARLAAATPGKWIVTGKDWRGNTVVTTDEGEPWHIAEVCAECGPDDNTPHNAAFIADAPTDLADVLAEVEALRADAERLAVEAEGADIAAVVLSDDRDELRDVLRDLLEGLDWWGVDPTDREFPSDTIRTARAVLDSLNPDAARATAAPTTESGGAHGAA